jgi:hypothetical protein
MPLSQTERATMMLDCFGCSQEESRAGIDNLVAKTLTHGSQVNAALASILSDAQELIDMGQLNKARQYLNRVKDALYGASPNRALESKQLG